VIFLQKLRTLCEECDWIAKWGDTIADTAKLYQCALAVVASGRRSSTPGARQFAGALDTVIRSGDYTTADLIDTFKGII
jgi:hypothetical protein